MESPVSLRVSSTRRTSHWMQGKRCDVVQALDLMRLHGRGAAHAGQRGDDEVGSADLLPDGGVLSEDDVHGHVHSAGSDAPRHAAHHLVEGRQPRQAAAEVAAGQQQVAAFLQPQHALRVSLALTHTQQLAVDGSAQHEQQQDR